MSGTGAGDKARGGKDDSENGSWREWARHVLLELQRLNDKYDEFERRLETAGDKAQREMTELRNEFQARMSSNKDSAAAVMQAVAIDVAMLKVKAGIWGAVGGALLALIVGLASEYLKK